MVEGLIKRGHFWGKALEYLFIGFWFGVVAGGGGIGVWLFISFMTNVASAYHVSDCPSPIITYDSSTFIGFLFGATPIIVLKGLNDYGRWRSAHYQLEKEDLLRSAGLVLGLGVIAVLVFWLGSYYGRLAMGLVACAIAILLIIGLIVYFILEDSFKKIFTRGRLA